MAVACGDNHTIVITKNEAVFGFGSASFGKLGTGDLPNNRDFSNEPTAIQVPGLGPVRQVAAGFKHTGIVTEGGDLFMCGRGKYGRLGVGDEAADHGDEAVVSQEGAELPHVLALELVEQRREVRERREHLLVVVRAQRVGPVRLLLLVLRHGGGLLILLRRGLLLLVYCGRFPHLQRGLASPTAASHRLSR